MILKKITGNKVSKITTAKSDDEFLRLNPKGNYFKHEGKIPYCGSKRYLFIDFKISIDEEFELPFQKQISIKSINAEYDAKIYNVTRKYPNSEKNTWIKQEIQAREYLLDSNAKAILIREIALKRGIDISTLVSKIINKADILDLLLGDAIGNRQRKEELINNATSLQILKDIK